MTVVTVIAGVVGLVPKFRKGKIEKKPANQSDAHSGGQDGNMFSSQLKVKAHVRAGDEYRKTSRPATA
jgi:hypothetical protein